MKKSYRVIAGVLTILIVAFGITGCISQPLQKFEETRSLMDTFVTITVYSPDEATAKQAISAGFTRMDEIEKEASIFDPSSEAFRLNQDGYLDAPSDDLSKLITMSLVYNKTTSGAFDITVQPLLDLWQYKPDADKQFWELDESTQKAEINEALRLVGPDQIAVEDNAISFKEEGTKITLGGIAKGYAVDEALKVIQGQGIKSALVDAGGDMRMLGTKPKDEPWYVALANPDDTSQSLAAFNLSDRAIATSGSCERYFDPEKKAHHIINPRTGYSANQCISVTIIAASCTQADTLATGVFVLGPKDGLKLVESLDDVECLIVDSHREIYRSSGLSQYLSQS
ncbi:MAG: FAD:protein FMN transferase [Dehalococcoidales bacterium]|nr:FAD:protein FMN transferase [Dehalococcoidales bacterium]